MKLYKHNSSSFTLVTHDRRVYGLHQQGDNNQFVANYCGKAAAEFAVTGTLLHSIPNFLKSKVFKLNQKPHEKKP